MGYFFAWLAAGWVVINFLVLGILDFDSLILWPLRQRLPFALGILAFGTSIGTWAWAAFGLRNVIGMAGGLVTSGPYRYSRNPQYIGDSLSIMGYIVLTNSWLVLIMGILGVVLNLLAPYTEEPWLEVQYGEDYRAYRRRVPRFIGKVRSNAE